jgi:hypothetical protein
MPFRNVRKSESSLGLGPDSQSEQGFWTELAGGSVLVLGLIGFGVYQWITELPPTAEVRPRPSPSASPSPSPKPTVSPSPGLSPSPGVPLASPGVSNPPGPTGQATGQATGQSPDIYQAMPKPGIYFANDPALGASRREVLSEAGRFCIKLSNGAPPAAKGASATPSAGDVVVLVSSLSIRTDGVYIDATQEKINLDPSTTMFQDSLGMWEWLQPRGDRTGRMAECLASTAPYSQFERP